jgi:hypothetical protein
MPVVFLTIKNVYGVPKIYPDSSNSTALRLAKLIGAKTFNAEQVALIKALGFQIQYSDAYAAARLGVKFNRSSV